MKIIPIKVQAGISGFESPASEYQTLPMTLDEILIDRPTATFIGLAVGDSMIGQGIFDGDLLIVDRAAIQSNLDVIVLTLNGVFTCKLINRKYQTLMSGNELHDTYHLKEGDDFLEEGIVIRSIRNHRKPSKLSGCLS
jgi:DNA polymerase V